jgi:hypothetical protein
MRSTLADFQSWYVDVLASLFRNRSAGFIIMMIAFSLIERYFRQKLELSENQSLPPDCDFYKEFLSLFPELGSVEKANQFWSVHRNGFLHQATFSEKNKTFPSSVISHDISDAIVPDQLLGVIVHPVKFCERVIKTILDDFPTYGGRTSSPSLPVVRQLKADTGDNIEGTVQVGSGSGWIVKAII